MTTVADGLYQYGGDPVGHRFTNPWGTHWFVDGTNGADRYDGKSPKRAKATIQAAVTAATGGDVIYINPKAFLMGTGQGRYAEDVTVANTGAASGAAAPQANKTIIGISPSRMANDHQGVRWHFATNTNLNVEAPHTHIENIGFYCEGATAGIYFESDGATFTKGGAMGSCLYNCSVKGEGGVLANSSDSLQFINNQFQAKYDGNTSAIIITLDGNNINRRMVIRGNHFIGGNGTSMDSAPIICTGKVEDGLIADNYFHTGTLVQINIATASSSGLIVNNFFAEANLSTTFIVQNGMVAVSNHSVEGYDTGV